MLYKEVKADMDDKLRARRIELRTIVKSTWYF